MNGARLIFPASDSLGVRSMSNFFVSSDGFKIAIDPGAALGPSRYGLPPHPLEIKELENRLEKIKKGVEDSNIVIITHYHRDHYPQRDDILDAMKGKTVIVKHPEIDINRNQRIRSGFFLKELEKRGITTIKTNGTELNFGNVKVIMDGLLWHGEVGSMLGKVAAVFIVDEDLSYYFASDSQGPVDKNAVEKICMRRPNLLYISGPPTYLGNLKNEEDPTFKAMENIERMISSSCFEKLVIDHHFSRELGYEKRLEKLKSLGKESGVEVNDVAGYTGEARRPLESLRRELYENFKEGRFL
jgi:hypothetical protein